MERLMESNMHYQPPCPPELSDEELRDAVCLLRDVAGLKPEEVTGLKRVRERVKAGQCNDITPEHIRLSFFKLLVEEGKIHD